MSVKQLDIIYCSLRYVLRVKRKFFGIFFSIAFGLAGFILLVTLGSEIKAKLNDDLELLGGATVIKCSYERGISPQDGIADILGFTPEIAREVRTIPGVYAASILTFGAGNASWLDNELTSFTLLGVDEYYWYVTSSFAASGEFFGTTEVEGAHRVCVLGRNLAEQIFGHSDVINEYLSINGSLYKIVAILATTTGDDRMDCAFIPFTTINDRIPHLVPPRLYVRASSWDSVLELADALPPVIEQFQSVNGLVVNVAYGPLKHLQRMFFWVSVFIVFAIVASIILGAFGVFSGMLSSVVARTREIGLKKAMGASDFDILLQFLAESLFVTTLSGIFGVGFGFGLLSLFASLVGIQYNQELFYLASLASFCFSVLLGFLSGIYPAYKASKLIIVNAIKYE